MMNKLTKATLALMISAVVASSATAAGFFFKADYTTAGDADIKNSAAEVKTSTTSVQAGYNNLTFEYKHTDYDFSHVGQQPFDSLNKIGVRFHHKGALSSSISYLASVGVAALYESDVDLSKSYNITPTLALGWTFNNGMTAFLGAAANLNDADNEFLPVIGLKIGDEKDYGWTGAIAYPATFVQYRFNPAFAVDATFLTVRDIWHLDDDKSKGVYSDGYCREKSYGVSLGATWSPLPNLKISGGVLSYFDRKFEAFDRHGNKFQTIETDSSTGAYVRASLSF